MSEKIYVGDEHTDVEYYREPVKLKTAGKTAEKIIRCAECQYFEEKPCLYSTATVCVRIDDVLIPMPPDGYCSEADPRGVEPYVYCRRG